MVVKFFTIWLSLITLIIWNGSFEGPKVFVFLGGGFLLSFYWIIKVVRKPDALRLKKKDFWYLGWLMVLIVSSLFGVHPLDSILGGSYRHQGVIFFLTLWLTGKTFEQFDKKGKRILYKGIGLAVILEGLVVIYQVAFGKLYLGKPLGTLGEASAVAGFLAIGSYFVFTSFQKVLLVLPTIAIILTQSRSGAMAFLANIGFITNILSKKSRMLLIALSILIVGAFVVYFSQGKGTSPFENRQVIWPLAVQQILKKPVLGYGAESGEVVFDKAFRQSGFPLSNLIVDRAHNLILDFAMWSGVLGLIFFSGFLYRKYKDFEDVPKKLALLSFIIYAFLQPLSVAHWILLILL